ncbi:hypothetical protein LQW54_010648 [Pestalotiopsis sp. IQ-011]
MSFREPSSRDDFDIAIVCALETEYNTVSLVFDEFWDEDEDKYGKAAGDSNHYTTGRIAHYNVVLALLPHMGKVNAAGAAASMRSSYRAIRLALIVGICGGIPAGNHGDILLGDVIISKSLVQYDFGRQYPDKFERKDTVEDNLGRPNKDIRNLLALFATDRGRERLEKRTLDCLEQVQAKAVSKRRIGRERYRYPGTAKDILFEPDYRHKHHGRPTCACRDCLHDLSPVCEDAIRMSCIDLGCDETRLMKRQQLEEKQQLEREGNAAMQQPAIHIGAIASGDAVIKSAVHRDKIAQEEGVIAFEMEGAGVWDEVPCIVVKGVCDYADCHKHKGWQNFAAATAAAAAKAILERYTQIDKSGNNESQKERQEEDAKVTNKEQDAQPRAASPSAVFHGPVSGRNVIAGSSMRGGTFHFR